jgi:hypothetical protein
MTTSAETSWPEQSLNSKRVSSALREIFDDLLPQNLLTILARAAQQCVHLVWRRVTKQYSQSRQIFRPCVLEIGGLAIAICLWGGAYKLSLYHFHGIPAARIPAAKLWVESRHASVVAPPILKSKPLLDPGSLAFLVPLQRLPQPDSAVASPTLACTPADAQFHSLIPARSPPSHRP